MVKDEIIINTNYQLKCKEKDCKDTEMTYCPICHNLMKISSPRISQAIMKKDGHRNICYSCYYKYHGFFSHTYRTNGKTKNINNAERIKIEISRFLTFHIKCYVDLTSLRNSGRSTFFGNENEISFEYTLNYHQSPTLQQLTDMMAKSSKRARLKDKKELLINKKFIKYLYECLTYSFNIGVDKKLVTLVDGL